jgi:kinesin family protein 13
VRQQFLCTATTNFPAVCNAYFVLVKTEFLGFFFFRWNDLKRKVDLWTEIHELNDQGVFAPVEINSRNDNATGGIFQLRQGQSRRIVVGVRPLPKSGSLPVVIEAISAVEVGSVSRRDKNDEALDSYQDKDLSM